MKPRQNADHAPVRFVSRPLQLVRDQLPAQVYVVVLHATQELAVVDGQPARQEGPAGGRAVKVHEVVGQDNPCAQAQMWVSNITGVARSSGVGCASHGHGDAPGTPSAAPTLFGERGDVAADRQHLRVGEPDVVVTEVVLQHGNEVWRLRGPAQTAHRQNGDGQAAATRQKCHHGAVLRGAKGGKGAATKWRRAGAGKQPPAGRLVVVSGPDHDSQTHKQLQFGYRFRL